MSALVKLVEGFTPTGRRRNPRKTQAAFLIAGGAALAAFFLFGRKAKAAGPGVVTEPKVDDDDTVDTGKTEKPPSGGTQPPSQKVDVSWDEIQDGLQALESTNAKFVFGNRPASFKGHKRREGQSLSAWLTNVAFWTTYSNTLDWPGGKIPNKINVREDQRDDLQKYIDAWVRINGVILGRFAYWRDGIFFSINPDGRIVVIGKDAWSWIDGLLQNPAGATVMAEQLLIGAWKKEHPNKPLPATNAFFRAKKKMIDYAKDKGYQL